MISIITVNYQNFFSLKKCWESLKNQDFQDFEWIIVDNNSPKGEGKILVQYFKKQPHVSVITLNKNIGFGAACNEGAMFAKGETVVFMNPDIEIKPQCILSLKTTLDEVENNVGIVVPQLRGENNLYQGNGRKFPTVLELFGRRLALKNIENKNIETKRSFAVDWAQGSFLMMYKSFFEKLGGFDSLFFLFMEDTDLCRRCWGAEKKVILEPKAIAIHGERRLSGGHIVMAIFKKTFWIHLVSMVKYFQKYKGKPNPRKL